MSEAKPSIRQKKVLVVEDQAFVRFMAMDMIAESGFGVIGAADADEAVRIVARSPDIDFVFSDIDMPGSMDGVALVSLLSRMRNRLGVIVTSGKRAPDAASMPKNGEFLPKPYMIDDVSRLLRDMVDKSDYWEKAAVH